MNKYMNCEYGHPLQLNLMVHARGWEKAAGIRNDRMSSGKFTAEIRKSTAEKKKVCCRNKKVYCRNTKVVLMHKKECLLQK